MQAWRIAKRGYALDRSGAGGLVSAGRWHPRGTAVIYAGLGVALCAVEKLVHSGPTLPTDLVLVALSLPDERGLYLEQDVSALDRWASSPPSAPSIEAGRRFLHRGQALGLIVPSAIVPEERNIVLNPAHPRFAEVAMEIVRPFVFDPRLRAAEAR